MTQCLKYPNHAPISTAFKEIDTRLGGVRRYHEQLSEEHAWYSTAEDRYTSLKRAVVEQDMDHVTKLAEEVNNHATTLAELKDNMVKLKLEQVSGKKFLFR